VIRYVQENIMEEVLMIKGWIALFVLVVLLSGCETVNKKHDPYQFCEVANGK